MAAARTESSPWKRWGLTPPVEDGWSAMRRLPGPVPAPGSVGHRGRCPDLEGGRERDVRPERMPDRAVLLPGEGQGPLDAVGRHGTGHDEAEVDGPQEARLAARAWTGDGPAWRSPSRTTGTLPARPASRWPPSQLSSTTTGGLGASL